MPYTDSTTLLDRGVHQLPILGSRHTVMLVAVTTAHVFLDMACARPGDLFNAADLLWDRLDDADPLPRSAAGLPSAG